MLIAITVFSVSIAGFMLGLIILLRDPRSRYHQVFMLFTSILGLWMVANYFSQSASSSSLFFFADFALAPLLALTFLLYGIATLRSYLPDTRIGSVVKTAIFAAVASSIFMSLATLMRFVTVPVKDGGVVFADARILYFPYMTSLGLIVVNGLLVFLYAFLKARKEYKQQARLVFGGLSCGAILLVFSNVILPMITSRTAGLVIAQEISYIAIFIMILSLTYSVIRYRLFDIRLVVARALGYLLSIGTLGVMYGFLAFNLVNQLLFRGSDITTGQQAVYTLLAVIIAFTFQPLKRFFDKWTNRIFYQDAYDGQALIDELNQKLVSTIELDKMLRSSSEILERNIKPEFCVFGLKETDHEGQRIIGNAHKKFGYQDISFARLTLPQMNQKVIVADYLEESHKELQAKMRKNDVAVLVRLTTDVGVEGLGAIALGAKKSGNAYNSQDIKVLEIVANSLVIAIDNALRFEEIQKFNITLEQKVEDATRKLRRANEKLIALDQTKDDFISMASHQLRTPLTSVKGYLSMVLDGDVGKVTPKQAKLLEQAFSSSQRMVYLIADLLNISRLRTGKFVIELKPTNLAEVIEGEVGQLKATASGKNQKLTYNKPKTFPTYMLDETKIRQVIMNFTDNALHYTQAGGHIQVALKETSNTIEFTVTDNGIGIPRHEQHHLFTKFFRAGNAKKARPDGTGLGLFMAKKVIIAQGGSVIFRSQEGKGSTFGFSFAKSRLKVHESSADKPAATAQPQLARSQPAAAAKTPVKVR